ncbi:sulfotransferase domain-containing protein [Alteromonas gracilis]|uniref:sulfotransferase domain-containing protein n=1 Tax=Alteromonas gracilis TaxID=1479524 RepID=UPI002FDF2CCB
MLKRQKTANKIILLGSGRSGTTWLAKLLDSCPEVMYFHEPDSTDKHSGIPYLPTNEESDDIKENAERYINRLLQNRHNKTHGKRPFFSKSYRSTFPEFAFRSSIVLSKLSEKLGVNNVPVFTAEDHNRNITRLIKSVDSVSRAKLFLDSSPNIKVVHLIRSPFAVVDSRLRGAKLGLMSNQSYLKELFDAYGETAFDISLKELNTLSMEEKFTYEWMVHNHQVINSCSGHRNYFFVSYDKLATNVKKELLKLFKQLQLPWSNQTEILIKEMLAAEKNDSGYFGVIRSPKTQLHKWKESLSLQQIANISRMLAKSELLSREFKVSVR